jgi:hypothetical protein
VETVGEEQPAISATAVTMPSAVRFFIGSPRRSLYEAIRHRLIDA